MLTKSGKKKKEMAPLWLLATDITEFHNFYSYHMTSSTHSLQPIELCKNRIVQPI